MPMHVGMRNFEKTYVKVSLQTEIRIRICIPQKSTTFDNLEAIVIFISMGQS